MFLNCFIVLLFTNRFVHHDAYPPVKSPADVARRKWLVPGSDYSIFTGRPLENNYSASGDGFEETHLQPRRSAHIFTRNIKTENAGNSKRLKELE